MNSTTVGDVSIARSTVRFTDSRSYSSDDEIVLAMHAVTAAALEKVRVNAGPSACAALVQGLAKDAPTTPSSRALQAEPGMDVSVAGNRTVCATCGVGFGGQCGCAGRA